MVERPIEVVEYQRLSFECNRCGQTHTAAWPQTIVPGQDLGVYKPYTRVGQLRTSVLRETTRTNAELGDIDIGYSASYQCANGNGS